MRQLALGVVLATALAGSAAAQGQPAEADKEAAFSRAFVGGLKALTAREIPAALALFKQCTRLYPKRPVAYYNIACAHSQQNKPQEAAEALRAAFERGYRDLTHIARDVDLDAIRKTPAFRRCISEFEAELAQSIPETLFDEPRGQDAYPLLVWVHDFGGDARAELAELRTALPKWGLVATQQAVQDPRNNDSSGEYRVISEIRRFLAAHPRANRRQVIIAGEGDAGRLVVGCAAQHPDLFTAILAAGPNLHTGVSDVDLSDTRAYLVVHKTDPLQVAAGELARDAFAKAGSPVVLDRYPLALPLSQDRAVLLRGLSWLQGLPVKLPGAGETEEF